MTLDSAHAVLLSTLQEQFSQLIVISLLFGVAIAVKSCDQFSYVSEKTACSNFVRFLK